MKKNGQIFTENIQTMRENNPELAARLMYVLVPDCYEVLYSKNNKPIFKISNITFHSLYDPVREGRNFVESHINRQPLNNRENVIVFGLGFAYHINAMLEKNINGLIIEPSLEIIRLAMEHVDLRQVIESMDIQTNIKRKYSSKIWTHQPSAKYNREAFQQLNNADTVFNDFSERSYFKVKKSSLKILLVSPIYGGSLPIAGYCCRALKKLGHDVHLWDASIFKVPFEKALELNLDPENKKVLHDLFLHLISEMIVATCSDFSPDLVIAMAQAPLSKKALERLRSKQITTAFWFVEDYQVMDYWQEYAPLYDLFFTIQEDRFFNVLSMIGVQNVCYLPLAADTEIHRPLNLTGHEKEEFGSDISFMGAGYYNRQNLFMGLLDFDFRIWGSEWDEIQSPLRKKLQRNGDRLSTEDTVKVFNASKINLNLHSSVCHEGVNPFGDFVNPRTFEIASCGSFQLVDNRQLLNKHFAINDEVVCYSCPEELREQIQFYLRHSDKRVKIAQQSRERILKEHTYAHRMKKLLSFVLERKPECFFHKIDRMTPMVKDINAFSDEYPEVKSILELAGKDGIADLDQILSIIKNRGSTPQYHEAIFILIKDFHELVKEQTAC